MSTGSTASSDGAASLPALRGRWLLVAYLLLAMLNVAGELAWAPLAAGTKPLLMPVLAIWVLANALRGERAATALLVGLLLAWGGDLLLEVPSFLAGMAAFAGMQVAYLVAFRAIPGPGLVRAWPLAAVPYALAWLAVVGLIWSDAGDLRLPIAAYGALLAVMACSALDTSLRLPTGIRWWLPLGGGLFLLSDAAIALATVGHLEVTPVQSAFVMATYATAQLLIATSVVIATHARN